VAFKDPPSAVSAAQAVRHRGVDPEHQRIGGIRYHLTGDDPRRRRLCGVADEKVVVPDDHSVVIVGIDDGAERLPAVAPRDVGVANCAATAS